MLAEQIWLGRCCQIILQDFFELHLNQSQATESHHLFHEILWCVVHLLTQQHLSFPNSSSVRTTFSPNISACHGSSAKPLALTGRISLWHVNEEFFSPLQSANKKQTGFFLWNRSVSSRVRKLEKRTETTEFWCVVHRRCVMD